MLLLRTIADLSNQGQHSTIDAIAKKVVLTDGELEAKKVKALSWENLHFEVSANIQRCYRKVVFFELVV
ncbi:MAG: hypothetical protein WD468_12230 [Pirellulales bacterium]